MKNKIFFLIVVMIVFSYDFSFAGWEAVIDGHRQDSDLKCLNSIKIGIDSELNFKYTSPEPPPPDFNCNLFIINPSNSDSFSQYIYDENNEIYKWVIAINPRGNIGTPTSETTTISWDPSKFGPGKFQLIEGLDENGTIVVKDMKKQSSFNVTGINTYLYYTIVYKQYNLFDIIRILQVLSGMK